MARRKLAKESEIQVNTEFKGKTKAFCCKRAELIHKISKYYNIPESSLEILQKVQEENKIFWEITALNKVQNLVKLKIQDKRDSKCNGISTVSESLTYNNEDIISRLRQNTVLTDGQRKRIVRMLENERQQPLDAILPGLRIKNKKLQVPYMIHKECQTEDHLPASDSNTEVNDCMNGNIKRMKIMHKNQASDNDVFDVMNSTFDSRRNYILNDSPLVLAIKEKYPLLFSATEIKHEFERILNQRNCNEMIHSMRQYSKAMLQVMHVKNSTRLNDTMKQIKVECQSTSQVEYVETVGALLSLPTYFDEMKMFIYFKDEPRPSDVSPYIEARSYKTEDVLKNRAKFNIITEKTKVCVVNDFLEALLCLMACYFIFNIEYPEACYCSLVTFEKLFMETHDSEDLPKKVTQFIKRVKKSL